MKDLIDQQAQQIQWELKLEEAAKSGFIYGLGVQKLCWETRYGTRPSMNQVLMTQQDGSTVPMWVEGAADPRPVFDDWTADTIDLADFSGTRSATSSRRASTAPAAT
jgi:hypothetical protein